MKAFSKKSALLLVLSMFTIINSCAEVNHDEKLRVINNLHLLPNGNNNTVYVYYNLKTADKVMQKDAWDLSFNWNQAYSIAANRSYNDNQGSLNFIDKAFNEVSLGDIIKKFAGSNGSTEEFKKNFKNIENFGLDTKDQPGWLTKASNGILLPVKHRTLILITPISKNTLNKKLYIIEIKSVYKDAPNNPTLNDRIAFISFVYKEIETKDIINL